MNAAPAPNTAAPSSLQSALGPDASPQPESAGCDVSREHCINDEERNACDAGGTGFHRERCEQGTLCLSGQCLPLGVPAAIAKTKEPLTLKPQQIFALAQEGWLNGWSALAPLDATQAENIVKDPSALLGNANLQFKAICSPNGLVPVFERAAKNLNAPEQALFIGFLISPDARRVVFKAGFGGRMRLFLNSRLALDQSRPLTAKPFRDEVRADAELEKGITQVVVMMERRDESASSFWLRVGHQDQPGALFFAPLPSASCSTADLLSFNWIKEPIQDGFALETQMHFAGLLPRAYPQSNYRIDLYSEKNKKTPLSLAAGPLGLLDKSEGVSIKSKAMPASAGSYEVSISAGPGEELKHKIKLNYRGQLHNQIVDLQSRLSTLLAAASTSGNRESFEHHIALLLKALSSSHPDRAWISELTNDAEKIAKALAAGEDPYREKTGIVRRAYRSELDGQLQPFTIYVPTSYKPDKKALPLIISFHGLESQPEHALRSVIGEHHDEETDAGYAARHLPAFPNHGVFLAAPWGFGKAGPRQLGEHDVLRVLKEMKENYQIDAQRVSITGASLGGTVAFVLPLHYPDLFSASAPLCGYPNLLNWNTVRSVPHTAWEDVLLQKRYIRNYAENGLHLPLHIVHGGLDGPERSRVIAERYRELGYSYQFDVQDDLDHNVWDYGYEDGRMIAWLRAQKRPAMPSRVRLVTGEYRYSTSYWVRLIAMENDQSLSEIDARRAEKEHEFRVSTRNTGAFALDFSGFQLGPGEKALIDGTAISLPEKAGLTFFEKSRETGVFSIAAAEPSRKGKKRPGVAGPLDDILRHSQRIVYGTLDPKQTESNRIVAEHYASYDHWAYAHFPIQADIELKPEDYGKTSLVLIGGPSSNRVTADLLQYLPLQFEKNAIVLRGKRHEGNDLGVSMIYPNPKNENEYIVIHAGTTEWGTLYSRHLPQLVPDYLVYDAKISAQRGETLLDQRSVLDGGFFDQDWH